MLLALFASVAFIGSYVIYHTFKMEPRPYTGDFGWFYYPVLTTHIILAAIIVPLALVTVRRGLLYMKTEHRKLARITWPIWVYVSVTGIIIYWMLY